MWLSLNKELEENIFDLGERSSANLLQMTQIKIAQYVGSLYSGDIMGELETKKEFVVPAPEYLAAAKARQPVYKSMICAQQANNPTKLQRKKLRVQGKINVLPSSPPDPSKMEELEEKMFNVDNEILHYSTNKEWM